MTYEKNLGLVLAGINAVQRNKGNPNVPVATSVTPIATLNFDSLDYAELLLHVELAVGAPLTFRRGLHAVLVSDLAKNLHGG